MRLLIILLLSPFFLISQTKIGNDIDGLVAGDYSGIVSFSDDGTIVAIGSPGNDDAGADAGHVRVFENSSGDWIQIGNTIRGQTAGDHFGSSISLSSDGSVLAIGSPDTAIAGYVRVYENIDDVWTQIGDDIIGEPEGVTEIGSLSNFSFGRDVSISDDGTILAIGEGRGTDPIEAQYGNASHIHMYKDFTGTWVQIGDYIGTISYINDMSLSADGSTVIVSGAGDWDFWYGQQVNGVIVYKKNISGDWTSTIGFYGINYEDFTSYSIHDVSLSDNGSIIAFGGTSIKVFKKIDDDWVQQGEDIENLYGSKISLSGNGTILAVGGSVTRLFKYSDGIWTQLGVDINEEASGDGFGASLELSSDGTKLVIGAPQNDGNGINSGHVRVYDLSALLSSDDLVLSQFSLFPNPAKDQFTITLNKSIELDRINIYNQLAQLISSTKETTVNTSLLSSGLYYVEVITNQGKATKKLVIE